MPYMFELSRIRTLDITQRGISLYNTVGHQVIQLVSVSKTRVKTSIGRAYSQKVFFVAKTVEIAAAKRQSAEVLSDGVQKSLGRSHSE